MQYFTRNFSLFPKLQRLQRSTLSMKRIPDIDTDNNSIDRDCDSLLEERMSKPYSWECPKKYSRYDICLISALEFWNDNQDSTECEYRIIEISWSPDRQSKILEPHSDIEGCSHDDPPESNLDTRSDIYMSLTSTREAIGEKSEDREHHEECCPDPDIAPWEEPHCSESNSERESDDRGIIDLLFSFLKKSDIYSCNDPREIDERPYRKSHTIRRDRGRVLIRDICLRHPSYQIGWTRDAEKWCESYSQDRRDKKEIFFHKKYFRRYSTCLLYIFFIDSNLSLCASSKVSETW